MKIRNFRICFIHGDFCHIRVARAVVSEDMTFVDHSLDKFRFAFRIGKGNEENGGNAFFFQYVKNLGGVSVFITFVESEINFAFVFLADSVKIRIPFGVLLLELDAGNGFSGGIKIRSGAPGNLFGAEIGKFRKIGRKFFERADFVFYRGRSLPPARFRKSCFPAGKGLFRYLRKVPVRR